MLAKANGNNFVNELLKLFLLNPQYLRFSGFSLNLNNKYPNQNKQAMMIKANFCAHISTITILPMPVMAEANTSKYLLWSLIAN